MRLFQTLDNKSECVGIYTEDKLLFGLDKIPKDIDATWAPAPYLKGLEIEFASLYLEGANLMDHLPEYLSDEWNDVSQKLNAFRRSLKIAHVNQDENCFYDLVPDRFLVDYCKVKNRITKHIFKTVPRPSRYKFYEKVAYLLNDISSRNVKLDRRQLNSYSPSTPSGRMATKMLSVSPYVRYKQFGTKTGRLTTQPTGLPLLTVSKEIRRSIKPSNDYYLELDCNGAEVRVLMGLLGLSQPMGDVHEHHLQNVFKDLKTRNEAKTAFFAWLYGSSKLKNTPEEDALLKFYDKGKVLSMFWDGDNVSTPYGKIIKGVSKHHALNYLVQSTAAELALKQFLKINYFLEEYGSGSFVAFLIHDAIIIDLKKKDERFIPELTHLLGSTNFGLFKVNVKKGMDLSMSSGEQP